MERLKNDRKKKKQITKNKQSKGIEFYSKLKYFSKELARYLPQKREI